MSAFRLNRRRRRVDGRRVVAARTLNLRPGPGKAKATGLCLALLAAVALSPQAGATGQTRLPDSRASSSARPAPPAAPTLPSPPESDRRPVRADLGSETASSDTRRVADWAMASGDHRGLPFVIVDKVNAKVFVFDGLGRLLGAAPALLGLARGDDSVEGIGQRRLATISPGERTTPAGRFEAALGHDFEQDILWIDYETALSLHRVVTGNSSDRRRQRLASPSPLDNRISYGCINVPAAFYDNVVVAAFTGTLGIVYILPETRPIGEVFALETR